MVDYIPQREHFIRINFNPQAGHEQKGKRPFIVVSHTIFNQKRGFVFVCPISDTERQNPFYINIPEGEAVTQVPLLSEKPLHVYASTHPSVRIGRKIITQTNH